MATTVLGLLIVLAAACIVLWVIGRAIVQWAQPRLGRTRDATEPYAEPHDAPRQEAADPLAWFPVPPDATLLRAESVTIGQASNPAPMLRMGTIVGTARWYRAPLSYPEVAAWYTAHLLEDGWQAEEGHGQLRVFRRERTLLWLADGEDAAVWQRLTNPFATPRSASRAPDGPAPTFTILTYDNNAASAPVRRGPFGGFGGFGGGYGRI